MLSLMKLAWLIKQIDICFYRYSLALSLHFLCKFNIEWAHKYLKENERRLKDQTTNQRLLALDRCNQIQIHQDQGPQI